MVSKNISGFNKLRIIVKRKFWKLSKLFQSIHIFLFSEYYLNKIDKDNKIVYLNIKNGLIYHRYYYNLAKYFHIEGYRVFIKKDLRLIYRLITDTDASYLIKENFAYFITPSKKNKYFELNDNNVSPDYYRFILNNSYPIDGYHIPIGIHPYLFYKNFHEQEIELNQDRIKSLFLAGNFYNANYNNNKNEKFFKVTDRIKIFEFLKSSKFYKEFKNEKSLLNYLNRSTGNDLIIVDRLNSFDINPSKILTYLSKFDFFLALPGEVMPLCHNIIEAMSVGTIPFLQQGYADVFIPPLENNKNCITFQSLDDIDVKIKYLFSLSQKEIENFRLEVQIYYKIFLSPKAIVQEIVSGNYRKFYLMAEYHSVNLLEEGIESNNTA